MMGYASMVFCILYYLAYLNEEHTVGVVCFEFRSEKFKCIRFAQGMGIVCTTQSTLVNYKGKLALLTWNSNSDPDLLLKCNYGF